MEIKTIVKRLGEPSVFDSKVNAALAEGWHMVKREVIPGGPMTENTAAHRMLYAELVKLDEPEPVETTEPETIDPLDAVRWIRDTCEGMDSDRCDNGLCPLWAWCMTTDNRVNEAPNKWHVPEKEADGHGPVSE